MKSFIVKTNESLDAHGATIKELGTGLRNLEKQVGQISTILSERIQGTLPADTERNPKETVNVLKNEVDKKKKGKKGTEKKKKEENSRRDESEESKHMPALPFPQKLYREKLDKKFERFLDMLKQVNINFPFIEVLSQMQAYAKFLKEILTKKRKIEETSMSSSQSIAVQSCKTNSHKFGDPGEKLENEIGEISGEDGREQRGPLILGRPFLATGRAILDILDRKLMLRVGEETVTFEMNVETGVIKEKPATSVEWKVKGSKEKVAMKQKCGVYPKKAEKKLSAWICALVRARGMELDFDSDPD
ncbi:uncharacterized protein [Nicotiana tomentosiformis]|uniref:uncharacterized protein n=1 Tax=Nicotiana tomentosiformis TaxID=4098 RepID=UPI00388CA07D